MRVVAAGTLIGPPGPAGPAGPVGPAGNQLARTAVKSANYTAAANDLVPVDTTSGAVTITLPNAPADKTQVAVKHIIQSVALNAVTVNSAGADVFNKVGGGTSLSLPLLAQGALMQYDAATHVWTVLSDDLPLPQLDLRFAPIASPVFTGDPKVPTPAAGDNDTSVANTSFVQQALTNQRLITQYGQDPATGLPNKPWAPEPTTGQNFWQVSNFSANTNGQPPGNTNNTSTLTPSLAGSNSGAKAVMTRTIVPATGVFARRWRVRALVTVTNPPASGNVRFRIAPIDSTGAVIPFNEASGNYLTTFQEFQFNNTQVGPFQVNYEVDTASPSGDNATPPSYFDLTLVTDNGTAGTTIALSNVSIYAMAMTTPPIRVAWDRKSGGTNALAQLFCDVPVGYDSFGKLMRARYTFGADNALPFGFLGTTVIKEANFTETGGSTIKQGSLPSQWAKTGMAANNSDTTMLVTKGDGVTTEYRGNTHGGETGATQRVITDGVTSSTTSANVLGSATANFTSADVGASVTGSGIPNYTLIQSVTDSTHAVMTANATATATGVTVTIENYQTDCKVYLDWGDGNGWTGPYLAVNDNEYFQNVYRVKIVVNTVITRSDDTTPYASIAKTYYLYRDGTLRYDRTFTFLKNQKVNRWFWHMTSFAVATGLNIFKGCVGAGLNRLRSIDLGTYAASPVLTGYPTVTGSGGAIPAQPGAGAPYSVRVTTLDAVGGESEPSQTYSNFSVTANNSTAAVTWGAVTGATGYAIYFGYPGYERRVATVAAGTNTYTITGSETPGQLLPTKNNAVTTGAAIQVSSGLAEWAIYYDPRSGVAYSMALDRAATLAMPNVVGARVDLQQIPGGLVKNYFSLQFSGADFPQTINAGTVYAGTLWYFTYVPSDPINFERDQSARASSCAQLASTIYPST